MKKIILNEQTFPDDMFRYVLCRCLHKKKNECITESEIFNIKQIDLSELKMSLKKNIFSLQGIENFYMLEYLDCSNTSITSLDITQNIFLTHLMCIDVPVKYLQIEFNPHLMMVNCKGTKIKELSIECNTELKFLDCSNTKISKLDVSKNDNLKTFCCDKNEYCIR